MNASYWAVALGSAVGGVLRFAIAGWIGRTMGGTFPWGTLLVNISGCLLIGLLAPFFPPTDRGFPWRAFLLPGICGGYTTFSSFGLESHGLWRTEGSDRAFLYMAASLICGVLAVWLGLAIGERFAPNSSN